MQVRCRRALQAQRKGHGKAGSTCKSSRSKGTGAGPYGGASRGSRLDMGHKPRGTVMHASRAAPSSPVPLAAFLLIEAP
jgi:hypothetical protein